MNTKSLLSQPVKNDLRLRTDANPTATLLWGVAALQILVGLLGWIEYRWQLDIDALRDVIYTYDRVHFHWADRLITFNGAFYIGFAILARRAPLTAAFVGAGVYATIVVFQALQDGRLRMDAMAIKVTTASLLLIAIIFALRRSRVDKKP